MTEPEPRTRPWLSQSALLAAVTVIGLVAVAALLLHGNGSKSAHTPPGATVSGVPPTQGNLVLRRVTAADVRGIALVRGDASALDVVVAHSSRAGDCSLFDPQVSVETQSATAVLVRASGYQYVPQAAGPSGGTVGFQCALGGVQAIRVHLEAPLADRKVGYLLGDRQAIIVVPADPADSPAPSYLPHGYALTALEPVDAASGVFTTTRRYVDGADELSLQVGSPQEMLPLGAVRGHATVDGVRATIADQAGGRCVTWPESSGRTRRLCSALGSGGSLPDGELLRIARGVR